MNKNISQEQFQRRQKSSCQHGENTDRINKYTVKTNIMTTLMQEFEL